MLQAVIDLRALDLWPAIQQELSQHFRGVDFQLLMIQLGFALTTAALIYVGLTVTLSFIGKRLSVHRADAGPPKRSWIVLRSLGRVLTRTSGLFVLVTAIAAGCALLPLPPPIATFVHSLFVIAFVLQVALWASVILAGWLEALSDGGERTAALASATAIIGTLARVTLWSIALLLILDNLGFNITTLVAGLGIGGIAVGLAAQRILGDLFASLAILLDKPFEYGDFIVTGNNRGTIERIGLKTTRLRSLTGEQIVIANADLLESRIQNFKRMNERRVTFNLNVIYGTPVEKLKTIPAIVEAAVRKEPNARFERCHLIAFGDLALGFECVYNVTKPDHALYVAGHETILLEIYRALGEAEIRLAIPLPAGAPGLTAPNPVPASPSPLSADGRAASPARGIIS